MWFSHYAHICSLWVEEKKKYWEGCYGSHIWISSSCAIFIMFASWVLHVLWFRTDLSSSPMKEHTYSKRTGFGNIFRVFFCRLALTFPVFSPLFFYRCFLSDSCQHPGGHTWPALHLENLQAVIARENPLHTWYTRCSPHGERGETREKNGTCLHAHWLFIPLKSSWISV